MTGADGIVMTGADGIVMTGADAVRAIGADGAVFSVVPDGLRFTGVTGIVMTGADGIVMTGADGIVMTGADGIVMTRCRSAPTGLQSVDPELALRLNQLTDDSNVNAVVVYHHLPTESDLADLQSIGILGGTRFRVFRWSRLPRHATTDSAQSRSLPAVRSIYGNRTLTLTSEPEVQGGHRSQSRLAGCRNHQRATAACRSPGEMSPSRCSTPASTARTAILRAASRKNIKLADTQSVGVGFNYPVNSENLPNTDQLYGHGTFVAGVIAGNGSLSGGKFSGVAPERDWLVSAPAI